MESVADLYASRENDDRWRSCWNNNPWYDKSR